MDASQNPMETGTPPPGVDSGPDAAASHRIRRQGDVLIWTTIAVGVGAVFVWWFSPVGTSVDRVVTLLTYGCLAVGLGPSRLLHREEEAWMTGYPDPLGASDELRARLLDVAHLGDGRLVAMLVPGVLLTARGLMGFNLLSSHADQLQRDVIFWTAPAAIALYALLPKNVTLTPRVQARLGIAAAVVYIAYGAFWTVNSVFDPDPGTAYSARMARGYFTAVAESPFMDFEPARLTPFALAPSGLVLHWPPDDLSGLHKGAAVRIVVSRGVLGVRWIRSVEPQHRR